MWRYCGHTEPCDEHQQEWTGGNCVRGYVLAVNAAPPPVSFFTLSPHLQPISSHLLSYTMHIHKVFYMSLKRV